MALQPNLQQSNGRRIRSARAQRYCVGSTLAVLFCPSSNGKVFAVTIDLEDLPRVLAAGPWSVSNFDSANGRVKLYCHATRRNSSDRHTYLHRFILNAPVGVEVDHEHNRSLDNRKAELRFASKSLNQRNRRLPGRGYQGLRGVHLTDAGRFAVRVSINSQMKQLGTYDTPELASARVKQFLIECGATYAAEGIA